MIKVTEHTQLRTVTRRSGQCVCGVRTVSFFLLVLFAPIVIIRKTSNLCLCLWDWICVLWFLLYIKNIYIFVINPKLSSCQTLAHSVLSILILLCILWAWYSLCLVSLILKKIIVPLTVLGIQHLLSNSVVITNVQKQPVQFVTYCMGWNLEM